MRLIDGRSHTDPCPESVFFFQSVTHVVSSTPPSLLPCSDKRTPPRGLKKQKTQRWKERDEVTEEEGGRIEEGVRNGEVRGRERGLKVLLQFPVWGSKSMWPNQEKWWWWWWRRRSQVKVTNMVSLSLAGVVLTRKKKKRAGSLPFGQRACLRLCPLLQSPLLWLLDHPSDPSPPWQGVVCHLNPTPRLAGLCSKVP